MGPKTKAESGMDKTVKGLLAKLKLTSADFSPDEGLDEQWARVKKTYFKFILIHHPDKGGDAAVFREINTSFEVLRDLYSGHKIQSFAGVAAGAAGEDFGFSSKVDENAAQHYADLWKEYEKQVFIIQSNNLVTLHSYFIPFSKGFPTRSWEYYEEAAQERYAALTYFCLTDNWTTVF